MKIKLNRKILDNGMNLLMIPMENTNIVSIGVYVKVGSRYENDNVLGISHFLEHLMFKGTKKYTMPELYKTLDNIGAKYNAVTTQEFTYYFFYGNKEYIDKYIDVASEIYMNSVISNKYVEIERGVIIEEYNMIKDEPREIITNILCQKVFSNSGLKNPVIGSIDTIKAINKKDVLAYRKKYYVPENTIISVAGDFKVRDITNKLINKFGKYMIDRKVKVDLSPKVMPEIIQKKPIIKYIKNNKIPQTSIAISFKTVSLHDENSHIYDLMATILGGGGSSRLFRLLRDKLGICYEVNAHNYSYEYEGVLMINAGVDNKRVTVAIKNILMELNDLTNNGINIEELNRAKNLTISDLSLYLQRPHEIMDHYSIQLLYNMHKNKKIPKLSDTIKKYKDVTVAHINKLMKQLFDINKCVIIVYGNDDHKMSL